MTLVVSALSDDIIVQVSDRRLTRDGVLYDDNANKAVCVICADAVFVLGYTGMALIQGDRGDRTDVWVANYLSTLSLHEMRWVDVIESLRNAITEQVKDATSVRPGDKTWHLWLAASRDAPLSLRTFRTFRINVVKPSGPSLRNLWLRTIAEMRRP